MRHLLHGVVNMCGMGWGIGWIWRWDGPQLQESPISSLPQSKNLYRQRKLAIYYCWLCNHFCVGFSRPNIFCKDCALFYQPPSCTCVVCEKKSKFIHKVKTVRPAVYLSLVIEIHQKVCKQLYTQLWRELHLRYSQLEDFDFDWMLFHIDSMYKDI